jgi:hypothetical protein
MGVSAPRGVRQVCGGFEAVSALLFNAFRALGPAASRREIALVAAALRKSGDEEVARLLDYATHPDAWERCVAMADEAGAYAFVALDLAVAFHNPGYFARYLEDEQQSTRT